MKTFQEKKEEIRRNEILDLKRILPYLGEVNNYLFRIYSSIRPKPDDSNQYSHLLYEIKLQLDFIASALTDENGYRFGGICQDGHIFRLQRLYEDSLQLPTKSIQEKLILELLIKVCTAIIIANGNGPGGENETRHLQADFALKNTRKFITHLVEQHELNSENGERNEWFDIFAPNYINSQV